MATQYIRADEVAEILQVSERQGYKVIKQLNEELQAKGYLTLAGRCPRKYFEERTYGIVSGE